MQVNDATEEIDTWPREVPSYVRSARPIQTSLVVAALATAILWHTCLVRLRAGFGKLEDLVSDIRDAVITLKEQMTSVATKHTVSIWMVGMVVVNFLTLAGHFLIGSFGGP